jgi:hypothetical protein
VGSVLLHDSVDPDTAQLFPEAAPVSDTSRADAVVVARRLDTGLLDRLESGGRVLLLPDGQPGSFALADHWFLRGGPYIPDHPLLRSVPRALLLDLQTLDWGGPVVPAVDSHLDAIDPVLLLWDTHDRRDVRTHGLIFETAVGPGRLLVSTLAHRPRTSAAGRWLLGALVDHLSSGPPPRRGLDAPTRTGIRLRLNERSIDLGGRTWRFRPDPDNDGLARGWQQPDTPEDAAWRDLRVDRHWEAQGLDTLDGWAWYRTVVDLPADWAGSPVYVSFRGVDDYYELYVDGQRAGSGGDLATRRTAFEERASHEVTRLVEPGRPCALAVRVHDWYGAGGIFRPVSIGTAPIGPENDWIR